MIDEWRGIYVIDPEDEEYKEIIENASRKLKERMEATMPCKKENKEPDQLTGNWSGA